MDTEQRTATTIDQSEKTSPAGAWLAYAKERTAFRQRFPNPWRYPIIKSPLDLIPAGTPAPKNVLDIGATSRNMMKPVQEKWSSTRYASLDLDRTNVHDYYSFDEVDCKFDVIMCLEVLEHLEGAEALDLLRTACEHLQPGGHMIVSVPNVFTQGIQLEFTHQTAFSPFDLGAALSHTGFNPIAIGRWWTGSDNRALLTRRMLNKIFSFLRLDYCQSFAAIATKPTI